MSLARDSFTAMAASALLLAATGAYTGPRLATRLEERCGDLLQYWCCYPLY